MKKFNEFVNEGVRDLMTGKSEEEILDIIEIKYKDMSLTNILVDGVRNNNPILVKYALDNGADPNNSRVMDSAYTYNMDINDDILKLLINAGVDLDKTININKTAIWILKDQHIDIVKLLIEKNPNIKDKLKKHADEFSRDAEKINNFIK